MKVHELKSQTHEWNRIYTGVKTAELRRNDRDYQIGDLLILRCAFQDSKTKEWNWGNSEGLSSVIFAKVTDVVGVPWRHCAESKEGLNEEFVILSFQKMSLVEFG